MSMRIPVFGVTETEDEKEFQLLSQLCLRASLVRMVAITGIIATSVWLLAAVDYPTYPIMVTSGSIIAGLALSLRLADRHSDLSAALVLVTLLAGMSLLGRVQPPSLFPYMWPLLLVAGAFFFGANAVPVLALPLLLLAQLERSLSIPATRVLYASIIFFSSALWLCIRELSEELAIAWRTSALSCRLTRQLQERQAELNKAVKNLELVNRLLQSTNRELEIARREAEEAREMKARFAASVSHELRTPLSIILGFTEIMTRSPEAYGDVASSPKLCRDIAQVRRSARYLSDLVDDILDLARIDSFKMPVNRQPTDLLPIIEDSAAIVLRMLEGKPVEVNVSIPTTLPKVTCDGVRISQLLLNLLTNAARFTHQGVISLDVTLTEEEVVVSVSDTGVGINPEEIDRIFDEFHHLDSGESSGREGKGLGLAIAKRIVQLHDGHIWCESELGVGSTFYFTLPLRPRNTSRLVRRTEAGLPRDPYPPSVLVLSDSPVAASYIRRRLDGYEVLWAEDAPQAKNLMAEYRPSALILNKDWEASNSSDGASWMPAGVPILRLSLPSKRWTMHQERFDACVVKPVSPYELIKLLQEMGNIREVLIVDDDRGFLALLRRGFESSVPACKIFTASTGAEALANVKQHRPDVVLLDVLLPDLDGFTVADLIRQDPACSGIRIVAVTGASLGEDELSLEGQELTLHLGRGFRGEEVEAFLRTLLASIRPSYV